MGSWNASKKAKIYLVIKNIRLKIWITNFIKTNVFGLLDHHIFSFTFLIIFMENSILNIYTHLSWWLKKKDPYWALKEFICHRPGSIDNFYLQTIKLPKTNEGYFAPSAARETAVHSFRSKFNHVTISELTGHADLTSCFTTATSMNMQRQHCGYLAGIRCKSALTATIEKLLVFGSQKSGEQAIFHLCSMVAQQIFSILAINNRTSLN